MSDEYQPRGQFNLRLSETERKRLKFLSAHYSISEASAVRMLIKKEHDRLEAMVRARKR